MLVLPISGQQFLNRLLVPSHLPGTGILMMFQDVNIEFMLNHSEGCSPKIPLQSPLHAHLYLLFMLHLFFARCVQNWAFKWWMAWEFNCFRWRLTRSTMTGVPGSCSSLCWNLRLAKYIFCKVFCYVLPKKKLTKCLEVLKMRQASEWEHNCSSDGAAVAGKRRQRGLFGVTCWPESFFKSMWWWWWRWC